MAMHTPPSSHSYNLRKSNFRIDVRTIHIIKMKHALLHFISVINMRPHKRMELRGLTEGGSKKIRCCGAYTHFISPSHH